MLVCVCVWVRPAREPRGVDAPAGLVCGQDFATVLQIIITVSDHYRPA